MRFIKHIGILSLLFMSLVTKAQVTPPSDTGLVYGIGHGYTLVAPEGWMMNMRSGRLLGLPLVMHPEGTEFSDAPVIMYSNVTTYQKDGPENLEQAINNDKQEFLNTSPDIKIRKVGVYEAGDRKAEVYEYINPVDKNYEMVAYVGEERVAILIVMASRVEAQFMTGKEAFKKAVASYTWRPEHISED